MQDRSTNDRWHRLLRTVVSNGALGVIAMVLVVTLACVVTGAAPSVIYALVALVVAFTVLIAVAAVLLRKKTLEQSAPPELPPGEHPRDLRSP